MTDQAIRVVPAGWYEDPADADRVRWWNGVAWTEHTNSKPESETTEAPDAGAPTAEPPTAETPTAGPPTTEPPTAKSPTAARNTVDQASDRPLTRREAIAAEGGHPAPDAGRSATGIIWLVALIPVIAFVLAIAALYLYAYVAPSGLIALVGLVPYLLGLLWAVSDSRQLAARGFTAPDPRWALLTPLGYLIARRLRIPGTGPLLLFVITAIVAIVAPLLFWVSGASAVVTVPVRVQHAVQTQLVDSGRLRSVSCPPILGSLTPGTLYTCDAVAKNGNPTEVWVSIDSTDGTFSIAPSITTAG